MLGPKQYIEELYRSENEGSYDEICNTKITVRCTVESAAMFNVISNRFGITRFELLELFLNDLSSDLFFSLNDDDIVNIAKDADLESFDIYKKQGVTPKTFSAIFGEAEGSVYWQTLNLVKGGIKSEIILKDE